MPISASHSTALSILLLVLAMPIGPRVAGADTTLSSAAGGSLSEFSHHLDIHLRPHVFSVTETIVLLGGEHTASEAIYRFELPAQAAITKLIVKTNSGARSLRSRFAVVADGAATRLVAKPQEHNQPDMGQLRLIGSLGSGRAAKNQYELRVFPVSDRGSTEVELRWTGVMHTVDGRVSVRIPDPGNAKNLARVDVSLTGAETILEPYSGTGLLAATLAPGRTLRFTAPVARDLVIEGIPRRRSSKISAQFATYPLSPNSGVLALRVSAPAPLQNPAPTPSQAQAFTEAIDRVIVLVDVSKSMGRSGLTAEATLVDGLLAGLSTKAQVEIIFYARNARRVLGKMTKMSAELRSRIALEIQGVTLHNGSNLGNAAALAKRIIGKEGVSELGKTLIVVLSDGILPTKRPGERGGESSSSLLGAAAVSNAKIITAVLVPDRAPLPDVWSSDLGDLARQSQGRLLSIRHREARERSGTLLRESQREQPLELLDLDIDRGRVIGISLSGTLDPGSSRLSLGYYLGPAPRKVLVRIRRSGLAQALSATRLAPQDSQSLAAITVVNTSPYGMPDPGLSAEESRNALRNAAHKLSVVSRESAAVAVSASDGFARDRLALTRRWGMQAYRRLPPPPEHLGVAPKFPVFRERIIKGKAESGSTGTLDANMIARLLRAHVLPSAKRCYEKLLASSHKAQGSIELSFELSRGEVTDAQITRIPTSLRPMQECVEDAMYALPVPAILQGADPEGLTIVRYPLNFQMAEAQATGKATGRTPWVDGGKPETVNTTTREPLRSTASTDDPLDGLAE